uniref:SCY1-like protein 2 n=1 Tax=Aceria tosichella TaxID=561515 RepID=A0A6G1SQP9_9ACAR
MLDMDSFVSKLRSTVSQVAYQVNTSVNTIIPGNLIHREYETLRFRCTYGSPGLVWSVFDAVRRDSASIKASLKDAIGTNLIPNQANSDLAEDNEHQSANDRKLYSVFLFDKNQLDNVPRSDREAVLEHIKKGVTQLTRLRHPAILTVHHPLEESRSSLAFVTEPVFGHVDSILKEQRGRRVRPNEKQAANLVDLSQDLGPKDSDYQQGTCQLDDIQIKAGLLQVCDGLKFLHSSANILHRNLCLENIFVDSNNTWKIAGFEFSSNQSHTPTGPEATDVSLNIVEFTPKQINSPLYPSLRFTCKSSPSVIVPNWSCSAPEHSNCDQVTLSSDVYSLGIISCALLGKDADLADLSYEYGLMSDTYKRGIRLRELADKLPTNFKSVIMKYAAINAESRPSLDEYQNLAIFADQQVQAIRDLDSQFGWDRLRKIDFFNRLRDILPCLSHQLKINRIAQSLFQDFVDPEMIPYVLPNILIIAKDSTPTEFKTKIFPNLKPSFRILEPKSVPNMLLDNLDILGDRARHCLSEFQQTAFTLIKYLLKMDQQMQEKCLTVLPRVKRHVDEKSLSELIIPELKRLQKDTTVQCIRVKILECLKDMIDIMSQRMVTVHVLSLLLELPTQEPEVVSATTSLVRMMFNCSNIQLDKEIVSSKILPLLIPFTTKGDLHLQQFDQLMSLIKQLMDRIEREQREILSKKSKAAGQKSQALVLNSPIVHYQ